MAELDAPTIVGYLNTIDAQILAAIANLGTGGLGSAQFVDYKIGQMEIKGSQRLESLQKARAYYQDLMNSLPSESTDATTYDVGRDGRDDSDLLGD